MKGLFISDLLWARQQKRLWVILGFLTVMYILMEMGGFLLAYSGLMISFLFQKSLALYLQGTTAAFYMTLPFSRRQFVLEKYLICTLLPVGVIALMSGLCLLLGYPAQTILVTVSVCIVLLVVFSSVMIPLTIRFRDNASLYLMGLAAVIGIIMAVVTLDGMEIDALQSGLDFLFSFHPVLLIGGIVLILSLLLYGSYCLSLHWMNRSLRPSS